MAELYSAPDYDMIVIVFEKFLTHKTTRSRTESAFRTYLLREQGFPAYLVRNVMYQIHKDENLAFHIGSYLEEYLVTGMLTGILKESACKFALKNKFGWQDDPGPKDIDNKGKSIKSIKIVKAQLPAPEKSE